MESAPTRGADGGGPARPPPDARTSRPPAASRGLRAEEALRPPEQEQDRERVDERRAALGHVLLEREVEHADQERRVEHAGHAAETADRDDDQEVDEVLERVLRNQPEKRAAEPAAERRHPAAEGERKRHHAAEAEPEPIGNAPGV